MKNLIKFLKKAQSRILEKKNELGIVLNWISRISPVKHSKLRESFLNVKIVIKHWLFSIFYLTILYSHYRNYKFGIVFNMESYEKMKVQASFLIQTWCVFVESCSNDHFKLPFCKYQYLYMYSKMVKNQVSIIVKLDKKKTDHKVLEHQLPATFDRLLPISNKIAALLTKAT